MIKHFIDIEDFSRNELNKILLSARRMKKNAKKYYKLFQNKSLGLLFEKESARTRLSFHIGMKNLSGIVVELDSKKIGFGKRESDEDILKTLSQYINCLMIRNNNHKKIQYYASLNILPIINGLSDFSHPCQILSDIFTLEEKLGNLKNKKICWVGDYNNVLRSLIQIQKFFLFELSIVLPKEIIKKNISILNKLTNPKVDITNNIKKAVSGADCIMTDVWISMGERNQVKKNYFKNYQVNNKIMELAKKNAIFMHCLPAHRGEEVASSVIDSPQSIVWDQAKNRMYVQQAILKYILLD